MLGQVPTCKAEVGGAITAPTSIPVIGERNVFSFTQN